MYTEDLLNDFSDIVLIGNATPTKLPNRIIDSFDTVIRFNNYHNFTHPYIGRKVDLHCSNYLEDVKPTPHKVPHFSPFPNQPPYQPTLQPNQVFARRWHFTNRITLPSTGLRLCLLLEDIKKPFYYYAFDSFKTPHPGEKEISNTGHSNEELLVISDLNFSHEL